MNEPADTLGDALPREIARVEDLLEAYKEIGPAGAFGRVMLNQRLKQAREAIEQGDAVAMLRAYEQLKGCE